MNHQCRLIGSVKNKVMNMMLITFQKINCFKQIGSCSGYAESGRYIKNRGRGHLNLSAGCKLSPAATTGSPEPIRSDRCGFKFAVAASISGFDSWVLERLWRVNIFGAYAVSFCTSLVKFFWPFHLGSAIFRITVRENENDRPRKQFYIGFEENDVFFVNKIKLFIWLIELSVTVAAFETHQWYSPLNIIDHDQFEAPWPSYQSPFSTLHMALYFYPQGIPLSPWWSF